MIEDFDLVVEKIIPAVVANVQKVDDMDIPADEHQYSQSKEPQSLLLEDTLNDPLLDVSDLEDAKETEGKLEGLIKILKFGNLSKRVDSLVAINETFPSNITEGQSNDLIEALTFVTNDIFDKPLAEIPLRFSKYFLTVVFKLCSHKYMLQQISTERLFGFVE